MKRYVTEKIVHLYELHCKECESACCVEKNQGEQLSIYDILICFNCLKPGTLKIIEKICAVQSEVYYDHTTT